MIDNQLAVTQLLRKISGGDSEMLQRLAPLIYDELHRLAQRQLRGDRIQGCVDTTSLVHEAYLKIANLNQIQWADRTHFFSIAALLMRRILIDIARKRLARKRGGASLFVSFDEELHAQESTIEDFVSLDDALTELESLDRRQCRIVEYRFFSGLSFDEIATVLGVSLPTVRRDWRFARAWLKSRLSAA